MPRHPLAQFDANLFVVLDSLLETSSVADTARQLGVTPSAVSHALARLREVVGDPILVRSGQRMVVTARARAMAPAVRAGLEGVARAVLRPASFDPATHEGVVRIASIDLGANALLPSVVRALREAAPRVDLVVVPFDAGSLPALGEGLDLVLAQYRPQPGMGCARLAREAFVVVAGRDHPATLRPFDAAAYASWPHVVVSPVGQASGAADAALAARGLSRRVALVVPTFTAATLALPGTDLLLTGVRREAERAAAALPLTLLDVPLDLPAFDLAMYWHPRVEADPLVGWVRGQLAAASMPMGKMR